MFMYIDRIVSLFGAWDDRNMLLLEFLFGKRSGSIALNFRKRFLSDWCYRTAPCLVLVRKTQRFDSTKYSEAVPFQLTPQYILSYSYSSRLMSTSALPVLVFYSYSQSLFPTRYRPPTPPTTPPLSATCKVLPLLLFLSCPYTYGIPSLVPISTTVVIPTALPRCPLLEGKEKKSRSKRIGMEW